MADIVAYLGGQPFMQVHSLMARLHQAGQNPLPEDKPKDES